jgi:hypothetical protein
MRYFAGAIHVPAVGFAPRSRHGRNLRCEASVDRTAGHDLRGRSFLGARRRMGAARPKAEHSVGTLFFRPAQRSLVEHRPDQEANARHFRPVDGRAHSGSSGARPRHHRRELFNESVAVLGSRSRSLRNRKTNQRHRHHPPGAGWGCSICA